MYLNEMKWKEEKKKCQRQQQHRVISKRSEKKNPRNYEEKKAAATKTTSSGQIVKNTISIWKPQQKKKNIEKTERLAYTYKSIRGIRYTYTVIVVRI